MIWIIELLWIIELMEKSIVLQGNNFAELVRSSIMHVRF
jgi:hypothetical protein